MPTNHADKDTAENAGLVGVPAIRNMWPGQILSCAELVAILDTVADGALDSADEAHAKEAHMLELPWKTAAMSLAAASKMLMLAHDLTSAYNTSRTRESGNGN